MECYQYRRHNKNQLMVHIIFAVKYRKPLLTGRLNESIKQLIYISCKEHHWYIKRMETDKDPIHILLKYNPTDCISNIVSTLKQYSTWHIWCKYESVLRNHFWKERTFWSDGYFTASIGQVSQETIEHYIEHQGK